MVSSCCLCCKKFCELPWFCVPLKVDLPADVAQPGIVRAMHCGEK